jgi:replicative DNA helicase
VPLSNEQRIISKIVSEKNIRPILDRGVDGTWFYTADHRDALEFILKHYEKYGVVPDKATIHSHLGTGYKIVKVSESMDALLDACATHCQWMHAKGTSLEVVELLKESDTPGAIAEMEKGLGRIRKFEPYSSHLVNSMDDDRLDERWEEYDERKTGTGLLGYSTGFPTIDAATLGLQNGQLVTILAQQKVGKTSLSLSMANHIYATHKKEILFTTFEMSVGELEKRQESLMAHINFLRLQQGDLTLLEEKKYSDWLDMAQADYTWPFHFMDVGGGATVSSIEAQVERHDPAVVFVDGVYMMRDEVTGDVNTWESLTNITRSLKRMAMRVDKPVVINTQALHSKSKGKKIATESAGYSSSFGQDSDVLFGLERIQPGKGEEDSAYAYQRILKVLDSRNTGTAEVELIFDYDEGRIEEEV